MYGAFIGDIVGSKYEFNNIKTKEFPLFSEGCDYTDDSIMTVAVARAIINSREERYQNRESTKSFRAFLIESMQDYGRRYPHPTGAYGGHFSQWLRSDDPKPYGSYGNGSAMRVSPCGLAAVELKEAIALARCSAEVSHDHPEGIKGAECVAAAVFLAKRGVPKDAIRQYVEDNFYPLDFTLDSIRDSYRFDGSCQGSVPQALVAFFESDSFEDAIRNVISIGGDSDTLGAITGSIAWTYYAIQSGSYGGWCHDEIGPDLLRIKEQAKAFLPQEFIEIADKFHEICWQRAGTHFRTGYGTPVLSEDECIEYEKTHNKSYSDAISGKTEKAIYQLCDKYVVLMDALYHDSELNKWCRKYSAYERNTEHGELEEIIYRRFMKEAYDIRFMAEIIKSRPEYRYSFESAVRGPKAELVYALAIEIRADYHDNGALINDAIAEGKLYHLMRALLKARDNTRYDIYADPDVFSHDISTCIDDPC